MSIQAVAWALDQYIRDAATKLVLISLANYADKKTGECWPTVAKICEESCQSKSTVLRRLEWLIDRGLVVKIAVKEESGRQRANIYRLVFTRMLTPDDEIPGPACSALVLGGGFLPDTPIDTPEGVTADTLIEPSYKPSVSPIAPKGAVGDVEIDPEKGWETDAGYQRLLEVFAPSLAWPKHRGYRNWRKLNDHDKAAAIAMVSAYREYCAKQGRKMSDPSAYLSGTFRNFKKTTVVRAPMNAAEAALRGSMAPGFTGGVLVEHGTDAWAAWQAVADAAGLPLRAIVYRRNPLVGRQSDATGKYLPSKWPPSRDGPDRLQRASGE